MLNISHFDYLDIAVVGCGSIGSFLTLGLAKLGFKNFILIDHDKVEPHNIPTQYYTTSDIGKHKCIQLAQRFEGDITAYNQKMFPTNKIKADVVFICVDSLKQRKGIVKAVLDSYEKYGKPKLIIDGRMHRLVFKVFTIPLCKQELLNKYVKSTMGEEFEGACSEKGIIQNIFGVTGMMIEQFRKVLVGLPFHGVVNCDFERFTVISSDLVENIAQEVKEE